MNNTARKASHLLPLMPAGAGSGVGTPTFGTDSEVEAIDELELFADPSDMDAIGFETTESRVDSARMLA